MEHYRDKNAPPTTITPDMASTNKRWQEDFRGRADFVIDGLHERGLDVKRAIALCDRNIYTIPEGELCISELERLEGILPQVQ